MKISNKQVSALAEIIMNKRNKIIQKKRKDALKNPQIKPKLQKFDELEKKKKSLQSQIDNISDRQQKLFKTRYYHVGGDMREELITQLTNAVFPTYTKKTYWSNQAGFRDSQEIENEILVASIDAESLAELNKKLNME